MSLAGLRAQRRQSRHRQVYFGLALEQLQGIHFSHGGTSGAEFWLESDAYTFLSRAFIEGLGNSSLLD
jgi:hypothetical protein